MDDPELDPDEHRRALEAIRRVNRVSGAHRPARAALAGLAREAPGRTLRVVDLAAGGGDVLLQLARWARRRGVAVELLGCDLSPFAADLARRRFRRAGLPARFEERDVLAGPLPAADAYLCSLFLHHLAEADARRLLDRTAKSGAELVVVNDLARSRLGVAVAWLGTRILTGSGVARRDGVRSVRAAFTRHELQALVDSTALAGTRVRRSWPWRLVVTWRRRRPVRRGCG